MKTMKVKELIYDWIQVGSVQDRDGAGEDCKRLKAGVNGVKSIEEHKPQGEGYKWSYLVEFDDGRLIRVFNPNYVEYYMEGY